MCNARLLEATDEQVLVKEAWTACAKSSKGEKDAGEDVQVVIPTDGDAIGGRGAAPRAEGMVNPLKNEFEGASSRPPNILPARSET